MSNYTLEQTPELAQMLLSMALEQNCQTVALQGAMGSGKTTLAKAIFRWLGIEASSPTFGLVNTYKTEAGEVYHFDFYRIKDKQELYDAGAYELLHQGFSVVEWPEMASELLPDNTLWVKIETIDPTTRCISIKSFPNN